MRPARARVRRSSGQSPPGGGGDPRRRCRRGGSDRAPGAVHNRLRVRRPRPRRCGTASWPTDRRSANGASSPDEHRVTIVAGFCERDAGRCAAQQRRGGRRGRRLRDLPQRPICGIASRRPSSPGTRRRRCSTPRRAGSASRSVTTPSSPRSCAGLALAGADVIAVPMNSPVPTPPPPPHAAPTSEIVLRARGRDRQPRVRRPGRPHRSRARDHVGAGERDLRPRRAAARRADRRRRACCGLAATWAARATRRSARATTCSPTGEPSCTTSPRPGAGPSTSHQPRRWSIDTDKPRAEGLLARLERGPGHLRRGLPVRVRATRLSAGRGLRARDRARASRAGGRAASRVRPRRLRRRRGVHLLRAPREDADHRQGGSDRAAEPQRPGDRAPGRRRERLPGRRRPLEHERVLPGRRRPAARSARCSPSRSSGSSTPVWTS